MYASCDGAQHELRELSAAWFNEHPQRARKVHAPQLRGSRIKISFARARARTSEQRGKKKTAPRGKRDDGGYGGYGGGGKGGNLNRAPSPRLGDQHPLRARPANCAKPV